MTETTMKVHGIDAAYYMTKDLDVSTKFYNELLGIEPTVHVPGMLSEYTFPDGESFGIYQSTGFYESGTVMFRVDDVPEFVKAAMAKGVLNMGEASAAKVFGTELTQQVARQLLEVLDHNGVRRGADAPLRGALESAYRAAVINTFGGGANEIQRDIIAMAGLGMPRAPRDLRAPAEGQDKSGGSTS